MTATLEQSGIYRIRNAKTGRSYIGSAVCFRKRWASHRLHLNRGDHDNRALQNAWNKYGPNAFVFEVILLCRKDRQTLEHNEQLVIDSLSPKARYNICPVAGSRLGTKMSASARDKIGRALRGRDRPPEVGLKIAMAQMGKTASPEARRKMRAAKLGKVMTPEARAHMSEGQRARGLRPAEEYASRRGRKKPQEEVERSAAARRGQKRSTEMIERMSEAAKRMDPAARAKIGAAIRAAKGKESASGVYGVTPSRSSKSNPWKAAIKIDGKLTYLGVYPTVEAAKAAVERAEKQ